MESSTVGLINKTKLYIQVESEILEFPTLQKAEY